jgi:hAT family C-terminal dimerisation region
VFLATSVDVERVFSKGRLLLSHVRSRLSAQTTRAILCLGSWSLQGFVKDSDARAIAMLPDVEGDDLDFEMEEGWDKIVAK